MSGEVTVVTLAIGALGTVTKLCQTGIPDIIGSTPGRFQLCWEQFILSERCYISKVQQGAEM